MRQKLNLTHFLYAVGHLSHRFLIQGGGLFIGNYLTIFVPSSLMTTSLCDACRERLTRCPLRL